MTTYTWPASLRAAAFEAQLVPNVRSFTSPYGGASQALDLLGERWRFALELPACMPHESGVREALFTKLRGGAHRVSLHHMARPQPVGTLRGLPTLKTTAAQGASSIVLAGCTGLNLLYRAGFEADGDADGMADGFSQYNSGTTGGITKGLIAGSSSPFAQRMNAAGLGATSSDQIGVRYTDFVPVSAGQAYTLAVDSSATAGTTGLRLFIGWYTAGGSLISSSQSTGLSIASGWNRYSYSATAPDTATKCLVYAWAHTRVGGPTAVSVDFDNMQFELGASASTYDGGATLKAGDVLGLVGSHLVMVQDDATAADSGDMTVSIANRLRASVASASAVTWYKPTADFMLRDAGGVPVSHGPGLCQALQCEFIEVWS